MSNLVQSRGQRYLEVVSWFIVILSMTLGSNRTSFAQLTAPSVPSKQDVASFSHLQDALPIGSGDVLNVQVFPGADLNQRVRVESDGTALFLLVGRIHVAGLRPSEAAELLSKHLIQGQFLLHPSTSIFVEQYSQGVKVFGEIARPSVYPPLGNSRLSDLIAEAGGFSLNAGRNISITRSNGEKRQIIWQPDQVGSPDVDVQIFPGDTIYVPKASIFYVGGNVAKPGAYQLNPDEKISLMQALFLAGGTLPSTTREKSIIVRTIGDKRTVIPVNVTRIIQGKDPDPVLAKNDIFYIPPSNLKNQLQKIETAAIAFAGNPYIYFR